MTVQTPATLQVDPVTTACHDCGAIIAVAELHATWHARLAVASPPMTAEVTVLDPATGAPVEAPAEVLEALAAEAPTEVPVEVVEAPVGQPIGEETTGAMAASQSPVQEA